MEELMHPYFIVWPFLVEQCGGLPGGNSGFPRREDTGPRCVDRLYREMALLKANSVRYIIGCAFRVWGHSQVGSHGKTCVEVCIKHFSIVTQAFSG